MLETGPGATLRHGWADGGEVRLHYVESGPVDGPPVILLHGFPEFWYSWRRQLPVLAAAGFRAVAVDMRGYNLSEKPHGRRAYTIDRLGEDVVALIRSLGCERADVVGHDWGGIVAYAAAMQSPERVRRLVVLNAPHPAPMIAGLRSLEQIRRSWYILVFQLPLLPELMMRRKDFSFAKRSLRSGAKRGSFSDEDLQRYAHAWARPRALTGMLNYYRGLLARSPRRALARMRPITAPTLVIWGERDRYIGIELARAPLELVPDLRLEGVAEASHWVQHEAPARVNRLILDFLGGGDAPGERSRPGDLERRAEGERVGRPPE